MPRGQQERQVSSAEQERNWRRMREALDGVTEERDRLADEARQLRVELVLERHRVSEGTRQALRARDLDADEVELLIGLASGNGSLEGRGESDLEDPEFENDETASTDLRSALSEGR